MSGHVVGKEKLSSSLSLCGEIQGLLELEDEHLFIEQPHKDKKELGCDMWFTKKSETDFNQNRTCENEYMIIAKDRATSHIGAVRLERGDLLATRTSLPELQASSHPRKHFVATARAGAGPTAAPGANHAFPTSQTLSWLPTRSTRFSTARREFTTRDMRIRGGNSTPFKKNGEGFQIYKNRKNDFEKVENHKR